MITKSPSHYDGKPVGTPTDAKSPWQAGVVVGPDHLERDAIERRKVKRERRASRKAHRASLPQSEQDRIWFQHKRRRARAQQWKNMLNSRKRRWTIADLAVSSGFTADEILAEIKWLEARQDRHRREKRSKRETKAIQAKREAIWPAPPAGDPEKAEE